MGTKSIKVFFYTRLSSDTEPKVAPKISMGCRTKEVIQPGQSSRMEIQGRRMDSLDVKSKATPTVSLCISTASPVPCLVISLFPHRLTGPCSSPPRSLSSSSSSEIESKPIHGRAQFSQIVVHVFTEPRQRCKPIRFHHGIHQRLAGTSSKGCWVSGLSESLLWSRCVPRLIDCGRRLCEKRQLFGRFSFFGASHGWLRPSHPSAFCRLDFLIPIEFYLHLVSPVFPVFS